MWIETQLPQGERGVDKGLPLECASLEVYITPGSMLLIQIYANRGLEKYLCCFFCPAVLFRFAPLPFSHLWRGSRRLKLADCGCSGILGCGGCAEWESLPAWPGLHRVTVRQAVAHLDPGLQCLRPTSRGGLPACTSAFLGHWSMAPLLLLYGD